MSPLTNPDPAHSGPPWRVGHGYDLHRLEPVSPAGPGRPLVIGGVRIQHDLGPVAHSDGDALAHAVADALLGAIGAEDLGSLFPNDDPRHDGEDSAAFVREAARRVREAGYRPANLDSTVVLERPRLGGHRGAIRSSLGEMLGIDPARVNVKGKTHEGVDALGEGRAIEAHAIVLLERA